MLTTTMSCNPADVAARACGPVAATGVNACQAGLLLFRGFLGIVCSMVCAPSDPVGALPVPPPRPSCWAPPVQRLQSHSCCQAWQQAFVEVHADYWLRQPKLHAGGSALRSRTSSYGRIESNHTVSTYCRVDLLPLLQGDLREALSIRLQRVPSEQLLVFPDTAQVSLLFDCLLWFCRFSLKFSTG